MGWVYRLHFWQPIGGTGSNSALHYTGWAGMKTLERRLAQHASGTAGVPITTEFHRRGIGFWVADIEPGTRDDERRIKRQHGGAGRTCSVCAILAAQAMVCSDVTTLLTLAA